MKKEEVIQLIADRLLDYEQDSIMGCEEHARKLLKELEDFGMKPAPHPVEEEGWHGHLIKRYRDGWE